MAKAQYLYSDGKPVVTETEYNIHKMDPPFAGNLILDSGDAMTMPNYCGRFVEQEKKEDGTFVDCVYSTTYLNYYYKVGDVLTANEKFTEIYALRYDGNWQIKTTSAGS